MNGRVSRHASEHGVTSVTGRQRQRVVGQVHVDDRLGNDEAGQHVAGHVENAQCVEVVQVLGQRLDLVVCSQQHLQGAQLTYVRDERLDLVTGDVQRCQQLMRAKQLFSTPSSSS